MFLIVTLVACTYICKKWYDKQSKSDHHIYLLGEDVQWLFSLFYPPDAEIHLMQQPNWILLVKKCCWKTVPFNKDVPRSLSQCSVSSPFPASTQYLKCQISPYLSWHSARRCQTKQTDLDELTRGDDADTCWSPSTVCCDSFLHTSYFMLFSEINTSSCILFSLINRKPSLRATEFSYIAKTRLANHISVKLLYIYKNVQSECEASGPPYCRVMRLKADTCAYCTV